ncbi:MAG: HAD hydrolase family protein [Helicobacter sp.]|nr:HAD hydrolase family protein [Helicobacter sp.]
MDIQLLILDVDGTLTDGKLYYLKDGSDFKAFNAQDGLGLECFLRLQKRVAIISGRKSESVLRRFEELNLSDCYLGVSDKLPVALDLIRKYSLKKEQVACVGDDLNDIPLFSACGLRFAPNNASALLKPFVDVILSRNGGDGAVREAVEYILHKEGCVDKVLDYFRR